MTSLRSADAPASRTIGDQLALAGTITAQLDLTGDARHRHIPGSPYEWRHGWIPLTRAAAMSHFHGHVPSSWHPASEAGRLSAPAHGRAEETVKAAGKGVEVAKVGKSWHLKENGQSLESFSSRKAAQAKMDGMMAQRARFAQVDAEKERRISEITDRRGISPVDYRSLKPGDQFATSPGGDLRTVTRAQHFDSGGSLVDWEANGHKDQTLFGTAGRQIYGRLSAPGKHEETVKAGRMSEPSAGASTRRSRMNAEEGRGGYRTRAAVLDRIGSQMEGQHPYGHSAESEAARTTAGHLHDAAGHLRSGDKAAAVASLRKAESAAGTTEIPNGEHDQAADVIGMHLDSLGDTGVPARETAPEHAAVSAAAAKPGGKKSRKKTAKAPAAQAAAPSAPAHTDFMSDAERQAAEAKYAKVMKAPGSPRYVAQAEHEMKQGRYGNAIGLMERADTLESNEGVGPSGPSRRAIVATITGLRAKQAEHIRAQRAKEAPAPAPTISEQLAMFGERTTSGKDVTSGAEGTLAPGDWHAGYQAIGAAPLDALPSERSRQVDHPSSKYGVNVKGAWSDPVWVAKPGGGFAISARWKSKAQKVSVYGGGPARTVDHPAHDERVIIPVDAQGRTAKQSAEQELKAEQARQAKAAADKAEAARKADAARAERQAAAEQKSIERNNRLVAEQRARNEQEAARKAAGAQTAQDRGLTEGARVFVDSGKHKGGIATVRSVGPDGRTMVEHYGGDLETMAPDHLRTQPSGAEETRRMNAVHEADKAKQQMAEQAKREAEAAERNSRGMDRMFARSAAGRQHFQEVTGFPFPQQERFAPDITEAEGLLSRGKLAEGAAALDRAIAAHEASQRGRATKADQARVDRVRKLRDRVAAAAANPRPTLPALAKVHGTNRKGSFTALDHAGNEYRIALRDDGNGKQVFVERDGQTLSAPAGSAPDITARELAGRLIEASLPEPERNRRQAAEMSMHAQELSARGGGYGHESIGYQIGQAAEALKSGDRQRAEALLRQAAMNDADTGRRVYSRTYGSAQEIIAKHLDRLSAGGSAAAPRAGAYEVDSSGGVTTVTTPDGYRLSDHTTEAQFNPQQTGQKLHDRIQRALASAPGRSPENARALADAQAARRAGRITQRQQDLLDQENDRVSMDLDTMAHGTGAPFVSSQFMDRNKPGKPAFGTIGQQLAAREPAKPAGRDYVVTAEKNPPGKGAVTGLRRMTLAEARQSQFASSRASSRRHVVHADTLAPDTGAVDSVQAASSARYSSPEVRDQVGRAVAAYTYGNYEDARASAAAALQSETNAAARAAISRLVRVIEEDRAQAVSA